MTEMKLQKEFFDLYQDARWGKFEITLVAPCIWKYNVTWPHTHITKLDFEKESRALEATIKEAWAQEDEDRAEMTLSLLRKIHPSWSINDSHLQCTVIESLIKSGWN